MKNDLLRQVVVGVVVSIIAAVILANVPALRRLANGGA